MPFPKLTKKTAQRKLDAAETTGETAVVAKIPQPHGGAINAGGTPGNKGGGRRPDAVRQLATTLGFEKALPRLESIMDDPTSTKQEVISACRVVLDAIPRKDEIDVMAHPQVHAFVVGVRSVLAAAVSDHAPSQMAADILADFDASVAAMIAGRA